MIRLTYRMDLYGLKHPPLLPVAKRGDKSAFIILSVRDDQTLPGEFLAEGAKGFVRKRTALNDLAPAGEAVLER